MCKWICTTLNGSPLSEVLLPQSQPLAKNKGTESGSLCAPAKSVIELSFSAPMIADTTTEEILFEELETVETRVSFLIHEKRGNHVSHTLERMVDGIANWIVGKSPVSVMLNHLEKEEKNKPITL
jgi:hypothetical protein